MQIRALLAWAIQILKEKSISDTPHLDAELLLAHVLDWTRAQLFARDNEMVDLQVKQQFEQLIMRRTTGEPIAYLLGYREFWSLNFEVTPATLIPRPETELLVELALQKFPAEAPIQVLDLGTGSGAIALAIAHERPRWSVLATDQSSAALAVAQRNAQRFRLRNVNFRQGHWCDVLHQHERFHLIISNPPYVADTDECFQQKEMCFEPRTALVADEDGKSELYLIVRQAKRYLSPGSWLLLEHGFNQKKFLNEILHSNDYVEIENHKDFSGISRIVAARTLYK